MSTLDQIIEAARTLPVEDRRSLMRWLREQERLALVDKQSDDPVREQSERFHLAMKWIDEHRAEYLGQWVALVGDRLISHGPDARQVHLAAKAAGIEIPFVVRVERKEEGPFFAGWL
ncbi:MAG TPA: DUF5678 domain-containing protein [Blastocatellia bacterium]|nr:DUF5678 domain-containing protein [Blastocatellia bacterium]